MHDAVVSMHQRKMLIHHACSILLNYATEEKVESKVYSNRFSFPGNYVQSLPLRRKIKAIMTTFSYFNIAFRMETNVRRH
jgi:hypothetical protein